MALLLYDFSSFFFVMFEPMNRFVLFFSKMHLKIVKYRRKRSLRLIFTFFFCSFVFIVVHYEYLIFVIFFLYFVDVMIIIYINEKGSLERVKRDTTFWLVCAQTDSLIYTIKISIFFFFLTRQVAVRYASL